MDFFPIGQDEWDTVLDSTQLTFLVRMLIQFVGYILQYIRKRYPQGTPVFMNKSRQQKVKKLVDKRATRGGGGGGGGKESYYTESNGFGGQEPEEGKDIQENILWGESHV